MTDPWAWGLGDVLTVVGVVLAAFVAVALYHAVELGKAEECEKRRARYHEPAVQRRWVLFRDGLQGLLDRIDRWFGFDRGDGDRSTFLRPWGVCLTLAFIYPLVFFLLRYAFADAGDLAGFPILAAAADWRRYGLMTWVLGVIAFFFLAIRFDWFARLAGAVANRLAGNRDGKKTKPALGAVIESGAFAVAVALSKATVSVRPGRTAVARRASSDVFAGRPGSTRRARAVLPFMCAIPAVVLATIERGGRSAALGVTIGGI